MNDQDKGIRLGLKLAMEIEKELRLSPAHFSVHLEYKGYKDGVTIYRDRIKSLYDKHYGGLKDALDSE